MAGKTAYRLIAASLLLVATATQQSQADLPLEATAQQLNDFDNDKIDEELASEDASATSTGGRVGNLRSRSKLALLEEASASQNKDDEEEGEDASEEEGEDEEPESLVASHDDEEEADEGEEEDDSGNDAFVATYDDEDESEEPADEDGSEDAEEPSSFLETSDDDHEDEDDVEEADDEKPESVALVSTLVDDGASVVPSKTHESDGNFGDSEAFMSADGVDIPQSEVHVDDQTSTSSSLAEIARHTSQASIPEENNISSGSRGDSGHPSKRTISAPNVKLSGGKITEERMSQEQSEGEMSAASPAPTSLAQGSSVARAVNSKNLSKSKKMIKPYQLTRSEIENVLEAARTRKGSSMSKEEKDRAIKEATKNKKRMAKARMLFDPKLTSKQVDTILHDALKKKIEKLTEQEKKAKDPKVIRKKLNKAIKAEKEMRSPEESKRLLVRAFKEEKERKKHGANASANDETFSKLTASEKKEVKKLVKEELENEEELKREKEV